MPRLQIKAGQFPPKGEKRPTASQTVLIPLPEREGYVFALWSTRGRPDLGFSEIMDNLIQHMTGGLQAATNVQHWFEQSLSTINKELALFGREVEFSLPIEHLHALIGVACDGDMYLSGTGDLLALFLHKTHQEKFQVFNLFRSIQTEQEKPSWKKPFAVLLDGPLHQGDVLCLSDEDLPRLLPTEEFHTVLSQLPPKSALEKIRQMLAQITDIPPTMLIIQIPSVQISGLNTAVPKTNVSMQSLGLTLDTTDRLLEDEKPHLLQQIKALFKHRNRLALFLFPIFKKIGSILVALIKSIIASVVKIGKISWRLVRSLPKKETRTVVFKETKKSVRNQVLSGIKRFNVLPATSKYFLLSAIALLFIFAISVSILSHLQSKTKEEELFQEQVAQIEQYRNEAQAALIYKDETKAKTFYKKAEEALNALETNSDERTTLKENLQNDITAGWQTLRKVIQIPDPPTAASFSDRFGQALFSTGSGLYALTTDKQIFRLDQTARQWVSFPLERTHQLSSATPISVSAEENTVVVLTNDHSIEKINLENGTATLLDFFETESTWRDIVLYGDRLYVLETNENDGSIVRFSQTGESNLSAPQNWIQSKTTSLIDATRLTIDGSVYVLKQTGGIIKFEKGGEISWSNNEVEPTVTKPTEFWTSAESDFIYVLEPITKRIIVFKKSDGTLVAQYQSDAFSDMTDIYVDEGRGTLYILTPEKLYAISVSHL